MENYERNDEKLSWRNQADGVDGQDDCFDELFAQSVRERSQILSTSPSEEKFSQNHPSPGVSRKSAKGNKRKDNTSGSSLNDNNVSTSEIEKNGS